ncbi:hypothetical protein Gohar_015124, partial [Gossypium harknessii]|nr:hypothetical protein [Gossypium harknessii]
MLQRHQAATSPFSLVRDIKQFCARTMQVEIRHIPREANQIANMMAKLAGNGQHELLVYNSAPLAVLHLLGSPRIWKACIINYLLSNIDAERILSVPLARSVQNDMLIWEVKNIDEYTVHSGYKLLLDISMPPNDSTEYKSLYKKLWRIKNLYNKRIAVSPNCPCCRIGQESTLHAIFECEIARRAIQLAEDMGFQSIEIEGDAHMIIRRLIDAQMGRSIIGTYIIDGKQVVACFGAFRFRFCSKNINLVAHQQATKSFDFNEKT